ncbi:MAG: NAD(P)H-dependent glycerol-3-phosphate dehydrogenase [Betaproteobacteria bacterium]
MTTVAILGAGAWGTALGVHLVERASARPQVTLWTRDAGQAKAMITTRVNVRYLPEIALPPTITVTSDLHAASGADLLVAATPAAALPELVRELIAMRVSAPLVWLSKGFVPAPGLPSGVALAHQLIAPLWAAPVGIVSGPTFAEEVARGLPAALTVAATEPRLAAMVATLLRGDSLRAYESDDMAGVEIGGAVKNVLAIAAGASDGLAFGHNARAALITRGLAETGRLSAALGGKRETLMGLAGLGDLVLTCTGDLSRNRRVGLALAKGTRLPTILAELGHVAEGVTAAIAVRALAAHHGVEMPICDAVYRVLHEDLPAQKAVAALLQREPGTERS